MTAPRRSEVKRAKARALAEIIAGSRRTSGFPLDEEGYRVLRWRGFSRQEVMSATDLLVEEGRATVDVERGMIVVRLTGGSTS